MPIQFNVKDAQSTIATYTDSCLTGCPWSRRATSGGHHYARQPFGEVFVANPSNSCLSFAEADLYIATEGSAETLGLESLCNAHCRDVAGDMLGEASAGLGISKRQGSGRLRHANTSYPMGPGSHCRETTILSYQNVHGTFNSADWQTNYVNIGLVDAFAARRGCEDPGRISAFANALQDHGAVAHVGRHRGSGVGGRGSGKDIG